MCVCVCGGGGGGGGRGLRDPLEVTQLFLARIVGCFHFEIVFRNHEALLN